MVTMGRVPVWIAGVMSNRLPATSSNEMGGSASGMKKDFERTGSDVSCGRNHIRVLLLRRVMMPNNGADVQSKPFVLFESEHPTQSGYVEKCKNNGKRRADDLMDIERMSMNSKSSRSQTTSAHEKCVLTHNKRRVFDYEIRRARTRSTAHFRLDELCEK